ncbi:MAG: hypothetical protein M9963_01035 [Kiritimatiellae bacterium]|nr:hypothetical protein [Kiritimatiellia bacterium]
MNWRTLDRRHRRTLRLISLILSLLLGVGQVNVFAQALRVGPFDLDARARLDAVYSTNIEGERKSQAKAEREDYYLLFGMDFMGDAPLSPSTILSLNTGFAIEKHFVRDDLDNSEAPFGRLRLNSATELQRLKISGTAGWERTSESKEDVVITGGRSSLTRNPAEKTDYGLRADWDNGPLQLGAGYTYNRERYEKDEFKDGDKDETEVNWLAGLKLLENLSLRYTGSRKETETPHGKDGPTTAVDTKQNIDLLWTYLLSDRFQLSYAFGYEKQDTDEEDGDWSYTHTFGIRDLIELNPRLTLRYGASYEIKEQELEDDVKLTYDASLSHEYSSTFNQQVSASREPRATFGSTQKSDKTTYGYSFAKKDLLIRDLNLNFSYSYEITKTPGSEEEKKKTVDVSLAHLAELTRHLSRTLAYTYSREDTNLDPEILEEHRVTWSYVYNF